MKDLRHMPDSTLAFIARDCADAIAAYPESPNTERYLATLRTCNAELQRRATLRARRAVIIAGPVDWTRYHRTLTLARGPRYKANLSMCADWDRDRARMAAFSIAWDKHNRGQVA